MSAQQPNLAPSRARFSAGVLAMLCFVLSVAAALRFYDLENHSPGFSGHAAVQFRIRELFLAEPLLQGRIQWPLITEAAQSTFLFEETGPGGMLEALWFKVAGVSVVTGRLFPALIGVLTVALAFLLGMYLHGLRAAFWGSLFLALAPWHIHFSRYDNTEHVLAPFHLLLCFVLAAFAMQRGRMVQYVLLGCAVGCSIYVYAPNQIVPGVIGLALAVDALVNREKFRRKAFGLCAVILLCAVVSYPQLSFNLREGRYLPLRKTAYHNEIYHVSGVEGLPQRFAQAVEQLFVRVGDPWLNKPGGGVSLAAGVLAVPGLCVLLLRLRRRATVALSVLMVAGLACSIVPAVFGPNAPFRRLVLTASLLELLAGVGAALISQYVLGDRKALRMLKGAAVFAAVWLGWRFYFSEVSSWDSLSHYQMRKLTQSVSAGIQSNRVPLVYLDNDEEARFFERMMAVETYESRRQSIFPRVMYQIIVGQDELRSFLKSAGGDWTVEVMPRALAALHPVLDSVAHTRAVKLFPRYPAYPAPEEGDVIVLQGSSPGSAQSSHGSSRSERSQS